MTAEPANLAWLDKASDFDWLAACADLHASAFPHDSWGVESLTRILAMPGAFGLAVPRQLPPAGFALARVAGDDAELLTLAVAPGQRRRGTGRALVKATARHAARLGAHTLFLEVAATNRAARNLYAACGFSACGYRPDYYATGNGTARDAVVLARDLGEDSA